ncbi:MAG: helix-turn-helix transcriptional regulator [Kiritimatiellae bacterium]|nr:helix-turn-helix transcriptional regulator [Kiritimatiellia bacterium]
MILTLPVADKQRRIEAGLISIRQHRYEPGGLRGVDRARLPHALFTFICRSGNRIYGKGWDCQLGAGDALLIPPRRPFAAVFGLAEPLVVINLHFSIRPGGPAALTELFPSCVRAAEDTAALRQGLEACMLAAAQPNERLAQLEFAAVLLLLARMKIRQQARCWPRVVQSALAFIRENGTRRIRRDEIAAACRVSPSHLSAIVRRETGITLTAHMQRACVAKAKALMQSTSMNFSEIAAQLHMDLYSFSRLFKKVTGASPSAYCKAAQFGRMPTNG